MMVRPAHFGFNAETAANNSFQKKEDLGSINEVAMKAREEFDAFVSTLEANGVEVIVFEDTIAPKTPDAVFPNNWISFHEHGSLITYPMYAASRRQERREDIVNYFMTNYVVESHQRMETTEEDLRFLEGTGSLILDRVNKIAYACRSERTDEDLFKKWCANIDYTGIVFDAVDQNGQAVYHTNVIMCVGTDFVVLCTESLQNASQKERLLDMISASGKELIEIDLNQVNSFAGNMLEVRNKTGALYLVLSERAMQSLDARQVETLESYLTLIPVSIPTIETLGGGSARCMMAEVFLTKKEPIEL